MGPGRPLTAIGTFGDFAYRCSQREGEGTSPVALTTTPSSASFRQRTAPASRQSECLRRSSACATATQTGYGDLSAGSSLGKLVSVWLDVDLENNLAHGVLRSMCRPVRVRRGGAHRPDETDLIRARQEAQSQTCRPRGQAPTSPSRSGARRPRG